MKTLHKTGGYWDIGAYMHVHGFACVALVLETNIFTMFTKHKIKIQDMSQN